MDELGAWSGGCEVAQRKFKNKGSVEILEMGERATRVKEQMMNKS